MGLLRDSTIWGQAGEVIEARVFGATQGTWRQAQSETLLGRALWGRGCTKIVVLA